MKSANTLRLVKRIIRWFLLAAVVAYIITGFGITEFRTVETLTLGWLNKSLAFKVHNHPFLLGSTLVLLIFHIYLSFTVKLKRGAKGYSQSN